MKLVYTHVQFLWLTNIKISTTIIIVLYFDRTFVNTIIIICIYPLHCVCVCVKLEYIFFVSNKILN